MHTKRLCAAQKVSTAKIMEIVEKVNLSIRNMALDNIAGAMSMTEESDSVRLRIMANSYEILHIQQEFRDYCSALAGCFACNKKIINVYDCIKSICDAAKLIVENKGVRLFYDIEGGTAFINADPFYLRQAMFALILNSTEHARAGGKIEISIKETACAVKVIVHDNGLGMDNETVKHCTEPLFTGGGTVNNKKPLGLGLTLVSHVVKNSNGCMTIRSFYKKCTRVELGFPKANAEEALDEINVAAKPLSGYDDVETRIALAPIL